MFSPRERLLHFFVFFFFLGGGGGGERNVFVSNYFGFVHVQMLHEFGHTTLIL